MNMTADRKTASYFELRIHALRPGAAQEASRRMRELVPSLLERAGVPSPLMKWNAASGAHADTHVWLLGWQSLDERTAAWTRLEGDPAWTAAWRWSESRGSLLQHTDVEILRASSFWAEAPSGGAATGRLYELRHVEILNRDAKRGHEAVARTELPFLQARGASVLGAYTVWFGARTPEAVMLLAWPDLPTRMRALQDYDIDAGMLSVRAEERRTFGRPLFGRTRSLLLDAAA